MRAAYESVFSLWGAIMGGGNLIMHAAGWMEGGLVGAYEKFALDCDLLQMLETFLGPLDTERGRRWVSTPFARLALADTSSARPTRSRAMRPPSTRRWCPTGGISSNGMPPAGRSPIQRANAVW